MEKRKLPKLARQALSLIAYIGMFIVISTLVDWWRGRDIPKSAAPNFIETTISGQHINLAEMSKDQLVVLYYWGTWCGACKATSPSVNTLNRFYPVVSVAMRSGSDKDLREYMQAKNSSFPVVNDDDQALAKHWGVRVTPMVVFVKDGQVINYTSGVSLFPGLFLRALLASSF
ncbi:MAG: thiol-disulfide isomerase/thioredoxin [Flavobacteriales bacterium]|jgi:thiol-disulfide isomerase/thioredoxin